jgi:hypothetical protein
VLLVALKHRRFGSVSVQISSCSAEIGLGLNLGELNQFRCN